MSSRTLRVTLLVALTCTYASALRAQERFPIRQLTFDPAQEGFPAWSPDGSTIVYSLVSREHAFKTGLWKISADGGEPWPFTDFIGEHPAWSPDGHYIVFDADSGNSIKLISSQGGEPIRLVPDAIPIFRGGNPRWSPDSRRVAFKADSSLWVLDVRTGEATVVYRQTGTYPIPGCWSKDGRHIYMTVWETEPDAAAIWKVSADGSERRRLTVEDGRRYRYMDLSPDGTLLVYVTCEGRNCDLWVMPADGGASLQLTTHPAYDDTPRWSPDGSRIAFTSTRTDNFDVWIIELDVEELRAALRP